MSVSAPMVPVAAAVLGRRRRALLQHDWVDTPPRLVALSEMHSLHPSCADPLPLALHAPTLPPCMRLPANAHAARQVLRAYTAQNDGELSLDIVRTNQKSIPPKLAFSVLSRTPGSKARVCL